jgi:hypothetical protein
VAGGWCWFVLREEYCWLVAGGWFVLRQKYCWLVADKLSEQADRCSLHLRHFNLTHHFLLIHISFFASRSIVFLFLHHCIIFYHT